MNPKRSSSIRQRPQASIDAGRIGQSLMVELGPTAPAVRRIATALARRFHQICVAMVAESVAGAGLTPLQFAVLAYLNKKDGEPGIDQISLSGRLGVDRNTASLLIEELTDRGFIDRRINGEDRRARVLALTAKGEKLYERLRANNVAANDRILEPLSPKERRVLLDLLIRVINANSAYARPGAGRRKSGSAK